jgi:hypothetical protein
MDTVSGSEIAAATRGETLSGWALTPVTVRTSSLVPKEHLPQIPNFNQTCYSLNQGLSTSPR